MHNLAMALHDSGHDVSGSDDEIFEPSRSRLAQRGILPEATGWFPEKIDTHLDVVILGMHARTDNPELIKAQSLGLKVMSYPEFLYEVYRDKTRVVIGGSHGKTTITSMIMHVLMNAGRDFDYMVGAQLDGFDCMVKISKSDLVIIEGDEYLSSPIDRRPKFHWYKPDIAILSGIAWDHINVFPTFREYADQFRLFVSTMPDGAVLVYFEDDKELQAIARSEKHRLQMIPYRIHAHLVNRGVTFLATDMGGVQLKVFGDHNLQNLNGAYHVCKHLGISDELFYNSIATFSGASKRLEKLSETSGSVIYRDFAHAPSKLKATVSAMVEQYADRELVACMELHTFSSLNKEFLQEYAHTMDGPEMAIVYFNPEVIAHKKLAPISADDVRSAFKRKDLLVLNDSQQMLDMLRRTSWNNRNLLLMSSGNFDGVDVVSLARELHHT